jgi:hypothetical protein
VLGPKRRILAGLFKFLADGNWLNEFSPLANSFVDLSEITTLYKNRLAVPSALYQRSISGPGLLTESSGEKAI